MTRAMKISAYVAMGLLMAASIAAAQKAPATTSGGEITIRTIGQDYGVESSKFTEYREVPKGASIPYVNVWSTGGKFDYSLTGYNVQQKNQQFLGKVNAYGFNLKFNVNAIPHDMGNNARTIYDQTATGVWGISSTLRQALQNAVDLPGSGASSTTNIIRFLPYYQNLLAPSFATANTIDLNGVRRTGNFELGLGNKLPLDVTLMYRNELKTGFRGEAGLNENFRISPALQVPGPMDELTQDFGLRAAKKFSFGNAYVTFNRSMYDNRAERLIIDFPFQAVDALVVAAQTPASATAVGATGGPSKEQAVMAPDNSANTLAAGIQLKFKLQTRLNVGFSMSQRKQDAMFYGYTAYSLATTTAMPQTSLNGKSDVTMANVSFSSRPLDGLTVRAQYRMYDLKDKTSRFVIPGVFLGTAWANSSTTTDQFGYATANPYDTKSSRYSVSATYDYKALTLEGVLRGAQLERTHREAEKGTENGMGVTALYHYNEWLGFRGTYDVSKRTAKGETILGYQMDEAPLTNTRTGVDLELNPMAGLDLSFGYYRRNVEYTDRPDRIALTSGVPTTGASRIPGTPSGLLESTYDSYTGEFNYSPNDRLDLGGFYTFEKAANTNQWSTTNSTTATAPLVPLGLNNLVNYAATDETKTYGGNVTFQVVPEKGTLMFNAMNQKVDGLMDITAPNTIGTFYTPARTGLIPAGQGNAADVNDWDDTEITTISTQFDWTLNKAWTFGVGHTYQKYDFKDAMVVPNKELLPASTVIEMKPNYGAYSVNLFYARMMFHF